MIIEQILVGHMAVFCYLIGDEKSGEAVLVDPASDFDKILECIEKYKFTVKKIINTHGHFDHISGNRFFIKKTGAELLIHKNDYCYLNKRISRVIDFIRGGRDVHHEVKFIEDNEEIKVGEFSLRVIHTPGHSPGSICLYADGNLFTGDTLFTEGTGRADFEGGSQADIIESIKKKILTLPDETIIWPGHHYGRFPVSTVREQKRYYL